jgi:hypothetical protein
MKFLKPFILLLLLVSLFSINAQTIVSTSPSNKNVVLEEFTGIQCQFCPDGHKRAKQISDANPGRVVLLKAHQGPFSNNLPDYKVPYSVNLGNIFQPNAWPSGMVNRMDFGMGKVTNRTDWAINSNIILGQPSPVNVGANATIDLSTRNLTLDVEAYYTSNGPGLTNRLHVVITQDGLASTQSGAYLNPTQILPNGLYEHLDMVRHSITPHNGDTISSILSGNLYSNQYAYNIPMSYGGQLINLNKIKIAVYVSEESNTGEVITGNYANINYTMPNGYIHTDLMVKANDSSIVNACDTFIYTPSAWVTNIDSITIDTFMVKYNLNQSVTDSLLYTSALLPGDSTLINFPNISISQPGALSILYTVNTIDYKFQALETTIENNVDSIYLGVFLDTTSTLMEDFQSTTMNNMHHWNPDNIQAERTSYAGGFGNSSHSFYWRNWRIPLNKSSELLTDKIIIPNSISTILTWSHAYAGYQNENDQLFVKVSTDCGLTWTNLWTKAGIALQTAPNHSSEFAPTATEWVLDTADLTQYSGQEVIISFEGVSGYGNNLFIDDINLFVDCKTTSLITINECQNYTSPSSNYTWSSTGLYQDTLLNANLYGCDSIISIDLTILGTVYSEDTLTECYKYLSPSGNYTWLTSGNYIDTVPTIYGCDLYTSSIGLATYQWIDCDSNNYMPGENNQFFFPSVSGNYAVEVTSRNCIDTSGCFFYNTVGINETKSTFKANIFPNPSNGKIKLTFNRALSFSFTIINQLGQVIMSDEYENTIQKELSLDFPNGLYYIQIKTAEGMLVKKIIIE